MWTKELDGKSNELPVPDFRFSNSLSLSQLSNQKVTRLPTQSICAFFKSHILLKGSFFTLSSEQQLRAYVSSSFGVTRSSSLLLASRC